MLLITEDLHDRTFFIGYVLIFNGATYGLVRRKYGMDREEFRKRSISEAYYHNSEIFRHDSWKKTVSFKRKLGLNR